MKLNYKLILFIIMFFSTLITYGQEKIEKSYDQEIFSIGYNHFVGISFMEDPVVSFIAIGNSFYNYRQYSSIATNIEFDIRFYFTKRIGVLSGLGLNKYTFMRKVTNESFIEKGKSVFKYLTFNLGYYYDYIRKKDLKITLATVVQGHKKFATNHPILAEFGFGVMFFNEISMPLYKMISISTGLFYKHSISKYNGIKRNRDFYPFAYGCVFGVRYKFDYYE